jgi:hypothetical protein
METAVAVQAPSDHPSVPVPRVPGAVDGKLLGPRPTPRPTWNTPLSAALAAAVLSVPFAAGPLAGQGAGTVQTWMDLEVRIFQEILPGCSEFDGGHWTVSFRQAGSLSPRRDETSAKAIVQAMRAPAGGRGAPSLSQVTGSVVEICEDGSRER